MYRIPLENEQITKTLTTPFAPVDFTEEEKEQIRENIGAGSGGGGGRNLLDNWWFGSGVINQRGQTSYTTSGYGIDRWFGDSSYTTVEIVEGGIKISSSRYARGAINQKFENPLIFGGKVLTVSVLEANGTITSGTITRVNNTTQVAINLGNSLYVQFSNANVFAVYSDGSITIAAVKIEVGEDSTLENDMPPDYATELLKCQRYFYRWKAQTAYAGVGIGVADSATVVMCPISLPVPMRAINLNSIVLGGNFRCDRPGSSLTASAVSATQASDTSVIVKFAVSGATAGNFYICQANNNANSYIDISADL